MSHPQDFESLWRASACEAVPHTDLFPEALLVLPEITDNSIAANATHIAINIQIHDGKGTFQCIDNGTGVRYVQRFLSWASPTSNNISNRYGHGKNKFLTKWCREYKEAIWAYSWRTCDSKGRSACLNTIRAPHVGRDTPIDENDTDDVSLMPSGTKVYVEFDRSILQGNVFESIKELLRTRYSKQHFDRIEFTLTVNTKTESSKSWLTFHQMLDYEVRDRNAHLVYDINEEVEGGRMEYKLYAITKDGRAIYPLKEHFPIMGQRNMKCSRIHVSLDGRMIEAIPIYRILGRESNHNDFNGQCGIVNFIPLKGFDHFPTPCTTKVSFYENCPKFIQMMERLKAIHTTNPLQKQAEEKAVASERVEKPPAQPLQVTPPVTHIVFSKTDYNIMIHDKRTKNYYSIAYKGRFHKHLESLRETHAKIGDDHFIEYVMELVKLNRFVS